MPYMFGQTARFFRNSGPVIVLFLRELIFLIPRSVRARGSDSNHE